MTDPTTDVPADASDVFDPELFERIIEELVAEYQADRRPWIVGISFGKDSTLLLQLVILAILRLPPSLRKRRVHVVSNDTLVESPVMAAYVAGMFRRIQDCVEPLMLPFDVVMTQPDPDDTFWVNLIGRGYPAPSRKFRWCTDRMKIRPTGTYIHTLTEASKGSVLLLGVRRDESAARAASIEKHGSERYNPHGTVPNCVVYRPIADVSTKAVWAYLMNVRPPWGGHHRALVTLYRNAAGGECPFVVDTADAPSCGDSPSSRFGCWTCTVVEKDRSLENLVDQGHDTLAPLLDFRARIVELSADWSRRMGERRNGAEGLGPFNFATRELLLAELLATQDAVGHTLITPAEIEAMHRQWADDKLLGELRAVNRYLALHAQPLVTLTIRDKATTGNVRAHDAPARKSRRRSAATDE